jgi:TRAP transporter TAXI family solute receptor
MSSKALGRPPVEGAITHTEQHMRRTISAAVLALTATLGMAACGGSSDGTAGSENTDGTQGTAGSQDSADPGGLPDQLIFSSYGVGSETYAALAAVAEAITENEGTSIRIIGSDTSVGRLAPIKVGKADMARSGEEYIYAFEADQEFATQDWGPQDLTVVWGAPGLVGLLVRDDSDIQSFEDLRGKKYPVITANPSAKAKADAYLAYGGLTEADVELVDVAYSEQAEALHNGKIDALLMAVHGPALYELDSKAPVRWLSMEDDSPEKMEAIREYGKAFELAEFRCGRTGTWRRGLRSGLPPSCDRVRGYRRGHGVCLRQGHQRQLRELQGQHADHQGLEHGRCSHPAG